MTTSSDHGEGGPRREGEPGSPWHEVRMPLPPDHARPLLVDALRRAGAALVETTPAPAPSGPGGASPLQGQAESPTLSAWFPAGAASTHQQARRVEGLFRASVPGARGPFRCTLRSRADWEDRWNLGVERIQVAPGLEIRPPGTPTMAATSLELVAGPGFGTASHPTTRGCLQVLAELAAAADGDPGSSGAGGEDTSSPGPAPTSGAFRILDVGSGSGILSVAAALLLGRPVPSRPVSILGLETDEGAVEQARRLAERNGVTDVVRFRRLHVTPRVLDARVENADLVVCNLEGPLLLPLVPALRRRVRPGGLLVLSGIPDELAATIRDQAGADPFLEMSARPSSGWWTVVASRGSSTVSLGTGADTG
ncbi:MAG: methyltransferase domain-containing protein [Gemmatimonadales bacterium]|nr:MAG: methyltransferase domain-containing protein [Gemmatimonadales bacterium]